MAGHVEILVVYSYSTESHQTLGFLALAGVVIFLLWFAPRDTKPVVDPTGSEPSPHRSPRSSSKKVTVALPESDEDAAVKARERERAARKARAEAKAKANANARVVEATEELGRPRAAAGDPIKGSVSMFLLSRAYDAAEILDVQPPNALRLPEIAWDFITGKMAPKLQEDGDLPIERLVKEVEDPLALFHRHYANGYLDVTNGTLLHEPEAEDKQATAMWQNQHTLVRLAKGHFQWKLRTVVGVNIGSGCLRLSLNASSGRYDVTVFLPPKSRQASWNADWEVSFAVLETILASEAFDHSKTFNLMIRPGAESPKLQSSGSKWAQGSKGHRWTKGLSDKIADGAASRQDLAESFTQVLTRLRPVAVTILAEPQYAYTSASKRVHALRADQLAEFIEGGRMYRARSSPTLLMLDCGPWLPRSTHGDFPLSDWTWVSNMLITISGLSADAKEDVYRLLWQEEDSLYSLLESGETLVCLCLETASDLTMLKQGMQRYCAAHIQRVSQGSQARISRSQAKRDVRKRLEAWARGLTYAYRNDDASALVPEEVDFQLGPLGD